jgi:hypothetical protein
MKKLACLKLKFLPWILLLPVSTIFIIMTVMIFITIDRQITKRPFSIPSIRPDLNQPNPRVGIGLCQFSTDGLFLASRNGKWIRKG